MNCRHSRTLSQRAFTLRRFGPFYSISYTSFLWLIAGAASLVLAIACANLGSLMLVRNRSREHLAATQVALGASAWRLMRAGLIETVLLSLAGTAVSLLVIHWTDAAARSILPPVFSRYAASVWDTRVLMFALLTAVACTAVAGAYPSWRIARVDVLGVLQRGNASARSGRLRGGRSLLIVESALSVMLVAGATMTVRSLATLSMTDLGFEPNGLYSVERELASRDGGWRTIPSGIAGRRCTELVARCRCGWRRRYQPDQRRPCDARTGSWIARFVTMAGDGWVL